MGRNLVFRAGKKAFEIIKSEGLSPDAVKVITGAAGGPKWLILGHMDRVLFSEWFKDRQAPLFLMGSSSGAWRFAAAAQADPLSALERFREAYIHQFYKSRPSPKTVSDEGGRILQRVLGRKGVSEILTHPFLRLNIMTVRSRGLTGYEEKIKLSAGLALAFLGNLFSRRNMGLFFERVLFSDPRDTLPLGDIKDIPLTRIPLNSRNLHPALLASGSIPLVMSGIRNIPNALPGVYRDGGVADYHMDMPFLNGDRDIVLCPHYTDRVIPGWFDKKIFWRGPCHTENLLLVSPSPEFLEKLPYRKIPDRKDFYRFKGRDRERISYWHQAVDMSRHLADEFMETVESGKTGDCLRGEKFRGNS